MVTDAQVRKVMEEMSKHGRIGVAAMKAGMDRKTARKYAQSGKLPSEMKARRDWRTREDPFDEDWPEIRAMFEAASELSVKAVFEYWCDKHPGRFTEGQLRTLQRKVRRWRATDGPPKEVFFAQQHRPGEAAQTDFTCANELGITIAGQPYPHLLCHLVLPHSNWQWATPCRSESLSALRLGVQAALFRLGCVPRYHQTDNSSAATHAVHTGKRDFNDNYLALMRHLGMTPRTTAIGAKEQNGDVEAANGALKRRLEQHLLLRGSRDFESHDDYREWLGKVLSKANAGRAQKVKEEVARMRPLRVEQLPAFSEVQVRVTAQSTIRVKYNTYSVPSRLIGERVRVRLYDDRLEVMHGEAVQETIERLHGRHGHRIDYRHVIWSLVRKPGAFQRYRYRDDLFPSVVFRKVYDALVDRHSDRQADIAYLRILHLAASTMEADVEAVLADLLTAGEAIEPEDVKRRVMPAQEASVPELSAYEPDVAAYDALLGREVAR